MGLLLRRPCGRSTFPPLRETLRRFAFLLPVDARDCEVIVPGRSVSLLLFKQLPIHFQSVLFISFKMFYLPPFLLLASCVSVIFRDVRESGKMPLAASREAERKCEDFGAVCHAGGGGERLRATAP